MSYELKHSVQEFERLERQSSLLYDYREELKDLALKNGAFVLDAGCGSGVVSRHLAARFPTSRVIACDYTASLLTQAREAAGDIPNLAFEEQDLKQLSYPDGQFDLVVCRFVLHHQDSVSLDKLVAELARVLKPGGEIVLIDVDGFLLNLYPQTPFVAECLRRLAAAGEKDLYVGRKIPYLLSEAGLASVSWRLETLDSQGESKMDYLELIQNRFRVAPAFYERALGGEEPSLKFFQAYLECLGHPQAVYFFHKFIVRAVKPQ